MKKKKKIFFVARLRLKLKERWCCDLPFSMTSFGPSSIQDAAIPKKKGRLTTANSRFIIVVVPKHVCHHLNVALTKKLLEGELELSVPYPLISVGTRDGRQFL